jgi:hypothetical protein
VTTSVTRAATLFRDSLDYTILRPAWLTDADEVAYEITRREEPFKGTEVPGVASRQVADWSARLVRPSR